MATLKHLSVIEGKITVHSVTLLAGAAYTVLYRTKLPGRPAAQTVQYYLVHEGRSPVVTYTTGATLAAGYRGTFLRSACSIRFTPIP
jgi:hypothetical protein